MGEDGARGKDWLKARGHHLCLTGTIFCVFFFFCFFLVGGGWGEGGSFFPLKEAPREMRESLCS